MSSLIDNYNIKSDSVLLRFSTSEAVVNYFIREIKEGRILLGDKLPSERRLQDQLQISRISLREGLARLSALGIIHVVHGKGSYVSNEISSTSLSNVLFPYIRSQGTGSYEDIFEVRLLIEERAAVLAAKKRSDEVIRVLEQILSEAENALDEPDEFGELDYMFHQQIAKAAGNIIFIKILGVINKHLRFFLYDHARDAVSRRKAIISHREIFECIKNKEPTKAGELIKNHITGCKRNYEMSIKNKRRGYF
jgi:GntR family transcriptional repressor for pyruvate dehydrogenase complex